MEIIANPRLSREIRLPGGAAAVMHRPGGRATLVLQTATGVDMVRITRIGVSSAFRVGAVLSAITTVVFGLVTVLLQAGFIGLVVGGYNEAAAGSYSGGGSTINLGAISAFSGGALVCAYLASIVAVALAGGLAAAALALFYNGTARLIGGLEVQVSTLSPQREQDALMEEIQADLSYRQ